MARSRYYEDEYEPQNPYHSLLDTPDSTDPDEDDLRWGLAVPEGWKNRQK